MKKQDIIDAYLKIRKIDNTIPDEVLDLMKESALAAIDEPADKYKVKIAKNAIREIEYSILKGRYENEFYLLSSEYCKDGDFYYDAQYDRMLPWHDSVEGHGMKGLGLEGKRIFRVVSATVNYIYGCGTKEYRSRWKRMEIKEPIKENI